MHARAFRGLLWAAAAAFASAAPAAAGAPPFTHEGPLSLSTFSVQAVVPLAGGKFRMYLTSASFSVLSATSSDQVNWSLEAGVRLSTQAGALDASSITAVGVVPSTNPASGWRMYYVGIGATGLYRVLSATSTDGLVWGKEAGTRLTNNGGQGFIGSLSPFQASDSLLRLYYVADQNGTNLADRFRVHSASATDGGLSWTAEGVALASAKAFAVSATTITGGTTRVYFTSPLSGQTTASQVLSATAVNGLSFTQEGDVRLSTGVSVSGFGGLVVARSTEPFRWRMYTDQFVGFVATRTVVAHALTRTPVVNTFTPARIEKGLTGVPYSLTGEVFSPACAAGFSLSQTTFAAATSVRADDTAVSGTFSSLTLGTGLYGAAVTNADGMSGTLANALEVKLPPGHVAVLDNLMRPLKGEKAKITVTIFEAGPVTLKLYTVDGGFVGTVFDGTMPAGGGAGSTAQWDGRTQSGNVVASGVYLLHAVGPNLNEVSRVVVVK